MNLGTNAWIGLVLLVGGCMAEPTDESHAGGALGGPPWRIAVLVLRETDTDYVDDKGEPHHLTTSMTPEEESETVGALLQMPELVSRWSSGRGAALLEIDWIDDFPVRALSQNWIYPSTIREILEREAPTGSFDSIIVVWDASGPDATIPTCAFCAWQIRADSNGATYAALRAFAPWPERGPYPGEPFVHEWLHGVTEYYRNARSWPTPDPHENDRFHYSAGQNGSWESWYQDLMTGRLWDAEVGRAAGFVPGVWESGTPTDPR